MLRSLIYVTIATVALMGCGKEQGVKARIPLNTYNAPEDVIQQGTYNLGKIGTTQSSMNSVSSQAIRSYTLGVRITSLPNNSGGVNFKVEHFEGMDQDRCRATTQTLSVPNSKLTESNKGNGITLRCYDNACNYLFLVIDRTHSSLLDASNGFVAAYVPMIMGTRESAGGKRNYTPSQARDPFLSIKTPVACSVPDEKVTYENPVVISPVDTGTGPDYTYFPDDDNNTWIY